jgi:hypothetical protein
MPAIPGALGFAAFAGVKFTGYLLAGIALKRLHTRITASVINIAAVRTGLGILLGLPVSVGGLFLFEHLMPKDASTGDMPPYAEYFLLACIRALIWALVIWLFTRQTEITDRKLWGLAFIGALWSCLLDLPGILLAVVSPGRIAIC